jgi:pyruvate, water dikinase
MNRLHRLFRRLCLKKDIEEVHNAEELRQEFKARNHSFKLLLNANNRALENMAKMEKALMDSEPFSISFVKAMSTATAVNVFRMVRNLNELSSGKYSRLSTRFKLIEQKIGQILAPETSRTDKRLVISLDTFEPSLTELIGKKMANLSEIKNQVHVPVPRGFSITSYAYDRFIESNYLKLEIDRQFQSADFNDLGSLGEICNNIQQLIVGAEIPPDLISAIELAYKQLEKAEEKEVRVALRSSALGEDMVDSSFAGQYQTKLNIRKENILQVYKEIVASKYSLTAVSYRYHFGYRDNEVPMSVGCMVTVDSVVGGVMYTQNPMDEKNDFIYISSTWGLTKSVVDGNTACDQYVVSKTRPGELISKDIRKKQQKTVCSSIEGLSHYQLDEDEKNSSSLTQHQLKSLTVLAVKLEKYFGTQLDIEWAISVSNKVQILQCRPLLKIVSDNTDRKVISVPDSEDYLINGGITVSPGIASGPVFQINTIADMPAFPPGAILVAREARPKWAPLLKNAAAVVTEYGGFAGHLANVAREFGVPAIFALENALDLLENGRMITLDADRCNIYDGHPDNLMVSKKTRKTLMAGSPVYKALEEVSRLIVPLTLLDPDAADFRPSNCKSLHDITRFIHEKSIQEMFNFGYEHNFSERSSKQLVYNKVPMQWWVLNLDDGFINENQGKYAYLENIGSIPMLALWEGIVTIPWEGPPPIDGRGLLSVMFQATANTALNTGVRSRYSEKNYFMISKNFCSLTTRLGFHFSTIEGMVSEKQEENYISFVFKGGAADNQRKTRRVKLLGEVLEENHFNIRIREDTLVARMENKPSEFIINRLKILGYLTIHTRQLDMIMANESSVSHYRKKMRNDIEKVMTS